jgi:hypothetical protein
MRSIAVWRCGTAGQCSRPHLTPVAIDAQGTAVTAALRISGTTVFIDVPHANADFAYPITVDPFIQEDFRFWQSGVPGSRPGTSSAGTSFRFAMGR